MFITVTHIQTDITAVFFKLTRKCLLLFEVMVEGFSMLSKFAREIAVATSFWIWRPKLHKIGHIFRCVHNIVRLFASMVGFPGQMISNMLPTSSREVAMATKFGDFTSELHKITITLVVRTISLKFLFLWWGDVGQHSKSTGEIGSNVVISYI